MQVEKAFFIEILMHRERQCVADAQDRAERVRTRAQVGDLAQEFQRMLFRLQRIFLRICRSVNLYFRNFYFNCLARALRCDQLAGYFKA
ncbi:hypothetical protein D3C87_1852340 [compost metagenome]